MAETLSHPLVVAVVGVVLGFILGRWAAWSDQRARSKDVASGIEARRISKTASFYVQLLDWEMRRIGWTAAKRVLPQRPRFSDEPDANLALLGDEQLMVDYDEFMDNISRRENTPAGQSRTDRETHVALVQRILEAAEGQTAKLLSGQQTQHLSPQVIAERTRRDRIEELKVDERARRYG